MLSINPLNPQVNDNFHQQALNKLKNISGDTKNQKKLKEAAQAFESIMVYQMFRSMNNNILKSNLIKENQGERIFKDFLLKQRSENVAQNTRLGIAETIYKQFSKYVN